MLDRARPRASPSRGARQVEQMRLYPQRVCGGVTSRLTPVSRGVVYSILLGRRSVKIALYSKSRASAAWR
jgi:hypothetical protein